MLKYTNKRIIEVNDWDKLVESTYGRPYSFQQQEGCKDRGTFDLTVPSEYTQDEEMNDSIPERINGSKMGVKFEAWLTRDPKEWNGEEEDRAFMSIFWERNFYPDIYTVANDLYKKGLIEAGEYIIDIDW